MKKSILFLVSFLISWVISAQTTTINSKIISQPAISKQLDKTTFANNQKIAVEKLRSEVNVKLQQIESVSLKTTTEIKTTLSSNISSYINNTLIRRTIDKSMLINPSRPYISEVYCPNSAGVKPSGEFLLIGANLLSSTGTPTVMVKFGQASVACSPVYGNSTSERLWVFINDFSGISAATAASVTVTNSNGTSEPVNITLLPELVTKRLNLSFFLNQLKSDLKTSYPMTYVTDISQGSSHIYTVLYNDILWVSHSFPYSPNRTTEYRGNDEFFLSTQLKNNWKVKEVIWNDIRSVCGTVDDNQHSSFFYESRGGTPSLYIRLGWYNNVDLCLQSGYGITYLVEGPKGTNYY